MNSANQRKKIPAVVEFYDIAGLVKGANKGEGLGKPIPGPTSVKPRLL